MKKGKISCDFGGNKVEVEAQIMSEQWAIHLDPTKETGKHYVLTHIPSGKRVWSSRTQTHLKRLIQEPEFLEPLDDTNIAQVNRLALAICRFCNHSTNLYARPKKKIGWE